MNSTATSTDQKTYKEGDVVFCVGRYGQKCANFSSGGARFSIPIWSCKEYTAKKHTKTGELYWALSDHFGPKGSGYGGNVTVDKYLADFLIGGGECRYVLHGERCNK